MKASFLDFFTTSEIYSVQVADVLSENSQNVTLLQGARNIDPNPSRGGGDVVVADNMALVAESSPFNMASEMQVAPITSDQISLHSVDVGDSLSKVAEMYGVSVSTIVWANQLSSDEDIHPGDVLLILPISGVQHVVKKGDTLKSLAKKYGIDSEDSEEAIEEMIAYNGLPESGELVVGETITIPGGEIVVEKLKPTTTTSTSRVTTTSSGPSISGYFANPMGGWYVKTQGIHGYNAVDFGADAGTPVLASAGGRVIVSRVGGWNGGYGNYVVIEHPNGTQTLYAHFIKNAVWQGQSVVQGQVIGYVGSTGRSTGNHLHFEVRGAKNPF